LPSKISPSTTTGGRFAHWRGVGRMMDALGRFGFTRALIFPYDELDFCRSGLSAGCARIVIWPGKAEMLYFFENFVLDPARRELHRGNAPIAIQRRYLTYWNI